MWIHSSSCLAGVWKINTLLKDRTAKTQYNLKLAMTMLHKCDCFTRTALLQFNLRKK